MRTRAGSSIVVLWFATFVVVLYWTTRNWQLVNDAALIRYATFLLSNGFAPYRQITDINLPGSYLLDWAALHAFGAGRFGLRLYDLSLLVAAGAAMVIIAPRKQRSDALCAACLFALFHGRDGAAQLGQRDLAIAALLLVAIAELTLFVRKEGRREYFPILFGFGFGITVGLATILKPLGLLFALLLIPVSSSIQPHRKTKFSLAAASGLMLIWIATALYLLHAGAWQAFIQTTTTIVPFHASLGYTGLPHLLRSFLTSSLSVVLAFALFVLVRTKSRTLEEKLLACGMAVGALCFLLQLRGYAYHRYPFIGCLLLFAALGIVRCIEQGGFRRVIGLAVVIFAMVLCPLYATQARKSTFPDAMAIALQSDLEAYGGKPGLDHSIQCIDTINGCLRTLYAMRLIQSTGTLYDEFLFAPNLPPSMLLQRASFLTQLQGQPPQVIVITPLSFPAGSSNYRKLAAWPEFNAFLSSCYTLEQERVFPRDALIAPGYRLYKRLSHCVSSPL